MKTIAGVVESADTTDLGSVARQKGYESSSLSPGIGYHGRSTDMNNDAIFNLSREIVGDAWELQNLIEDANDAVGELDYEATEEEDKAKVNRIYRVVSKIEDIAHGILNSIDNRVPEGYIDPKSEE